MLTKETILEITSGFIFLTTIFTMLYFALWIFA